MLKRTLWIATSSIFIAATSLTAQSSWSVDLRAGPAFATQEAADSDLDTGFGFEGTLAYRFLPHLAGYAGWDWHTFGASDSLAGLEADIEETGYVAGLRFEHPLAGESGPGPAVRLHAGATYNHIEIEDDDGEIVADSGHGFGWEAGAGLSFPVSDALRLTPGVRYRALSRDVDVDDVTIGVDLRYVAAEVGVSWSF